MSTFHVGETESQKGGNRIPEPNGEYDLNGGKSICNMKPFDSFGGSDYDASVSSMSETNLNDAFDEAVEDSEGRKCAPQCIGKVVHDRIIDEVEFSFQPNFVEVSGKIIKSKKMYLSKRLGNKISNLTPLDSPVIRAKKLDFNDNLIDVSFVSNEEQTEKVIKIHRRRPKKVQKQH